MLSGLIAAAMAVPAAAPAPASATQAAAGQAGWTTTHHDLARGIVHTVLERHAPDLHVDVARIAPDAKVRLRPVLAHDRVGEEDPAHRREPTSGMCGRAGGLLCINADFAACPTCRQPFGGIVADGRTVRSFHPYHEQFSATDKGFTTDRLQWGGRLLVTYKWHRTIPLPIGGDGSGHRIDTTTETREVPLAAINVDPIADAAVLYTPEWAARTPPGADRVEVTMGTDGPVRTGAVAARFLDRRQGDGPIPGADTVVSGHGQAGSALAKLWDEWHATDADEKHLVVETGVDPAVQLSVGGHPVLLRDGQDMPLDPADPKVANRHPRTLVGWTAGGELLLVTVDGRQRGHSVGVTLPEAAAMLRELGAVSGINLDGGGSSTFVGPCPQGPCVLNRPSDGRERPVPLALAVVPDGPLEAAAPVPPPPPLPPPAPAPPPEPDPASIPHAHRVSTPPPPPDPVTEAAIEEIEVAPVVPAALPRTIRGVSTDRGRYRPVRVRTVVRDPGPPPLGTSEPSRLAPWLAFAALGIAAVAGSRLADRRA